MERREFLEKLGIGAAFALTATCLGSCTKDTVAAKVDFTLNLDEAANASLKNNGGYVISNGCVVAKTTAGAYVAATVTCSHNNFKEVIYDENANEFYCNVHGARFDLQGKGKNATGSGGLAIYQTSLTGNSLRVFS